jgi:hypothetical protein
LNFNVPSDAQPVSIFVVCQVMTITFQINTDIGIIDSDDDDVLKIIEERLMQVFIKIGVTIQG